MKRVLAYISCCALGWSISSDAALAQTSVPADASDTRPPAAPTTEPSADDVGMEPLSGNEIVITAQRRTQRLQDVPISVAAFTGETIQRLGASRIVDVFAQTPGVRAQAPSGNSGLPVFNIRGVTLLDFSYANESSVAVYADDVYLGNPAFGTLQLFDVDRVEILRGPQGTLYGRNATGGLVRYISRRPTDTFEGRALLQYSTDNNIVFETGFSGPVTDRIRVRVAGRYNHDDGWQTNQVFGNKLSSVDHSIGLRATLEADLSDSILLTVSGNYGDTTGQEDGRAFFGTRVIGMPTVRCTPEQVLASQCGDASGFRDPDPDPRRPFSNQRDIPYALQAAGGLARLEADLGWAKLTSITAYQWGRKFDQIDGDGSATSLVNQQVNYFVRHRQFSQEARLNGDTGRFNWLLGAFYYTDTRFTTFALPALRVGNFLDQKITSISGFGQGTYALTDALNITAGIRYTKDKKELQDFGIVLDPVTATRQGTRFFSASGEIDPGKVTWRLAADYHINRDVMLFASASTGFKSGGYNGSVVSPASGIGPVEPETLTTYEIGVKASLFDRRLTANVTGFYSDYRDIQAAAVVPCTNGCTGGTTNQYLNIGDAKIYGFEAELTARIANELTLSGGLAYNHNEVSAPLTVTVAGVPVNGKRLANTPKISLNGTFDWRPSLGEGRGSLVFGGDVSYQTKYFFRPDNAIIASQKAFALVGARAGWIASDDLTLEFFARNLLNKEYFNSRTDAGETAPAVWGRPRELGIRALTRF